MTKREAKRTLRLKRQQLRQLTALTDDQVAEVAGGWEIYNDINGRIRSRCCAG